MPAVAAQRRGGYIPRMAMGRLKLAIAQLNPVVTHGCRFDDDHLSRAAARTEVLPERIRRQTLLTVMSYFVFLHLNSLMSDKLQFVVC